jgi:hypothetical protein
LQLLDRLDGAPQLLQLLVHEVQPVSILSGLEDGARIDAVRDCYDRLPSSSEKSISASASSISRC